jgi:hypothetical protein
VFDPRTKKLSLRPRVPVKVTSGKPVDLSRWAGEAPSRTVLEQMTEAIMLDIRGLVGELRDETPPPLYQPTARRNQKSVEPGPEAAE